MTFRMREIKHCSGSKCGQRRQSWKHSQMAEDRLECRLGKGVGVIGQVEDMHTRSACSPTPRVEPRQVRLMRTRDQ